MRFPLSVLPLLCVVCLPWPQDVGAAGRPPNARSGARPKIPWIVETGDRGHIPEPPGIVPPFTDEIYDWFGTPAWHEP
ncbi:MAG: hypothetical protein PHO07_09665 [Pirellulales bacterium]|jgi:hypothetical protein|nr:hypothetical protein [Thermoguttaceae bacterium]MDD4787427.1 hypothetical protein [Pirellulales bacterium]MDI9443694.1 hypothetical protein [Planctomycetota bacterium]NLY99115.1 hypothetical protein [Pirellulaceae bacterium]